MKHTLLTSVIAVTLPSVAFAQNTERTFYNDAEANRARDREAAYIAADPGMSVVDETERVRRVQLTPMAGMEVAYADTQLYRAAGSTVISSRVGYAPTYGLAADVRIGYFTLGTRYQGSVFVDADPLLLDLYLNKFYGDIGFNVRAKVLLFSAFLSGGYALAVTRDAVHHGAGGKVGLAFDFLVSRVVSIGPGFAFDVHAYRPQGTPEGTWVTAFGGTSQLRVGFHI